jgi:hypothetical protein
MAQPFFPAFNEWQAAHFLKTFSPALISPADADVALVPTSPTTMAEATSAPRTTVLENVIPTLPLLDDSCPLLCGVVWRLIQRNGHHIGSRHVTMT